MNNSISEELGVNCKVEIISGDQRLLVEKCVYGNIENKRNIRNEHNQLIEKRIPTAIFGIKSTGKEVQVLDSFLDSLDGKNDLIVKIYNGDQLMQPILINGMVYRQTSFSDEMTYDVQIIGEKSFV